MANTSTSLNDHIVFITKTREQWLENIVRERLLLSISASMALIR